MGLDQAERLAKRRDLKLVKVEDPTLTKGSNDVYRLLTGKQYFEEEVRSKKSDKKSPTSIKVTIQVCLIFLNGTHYRQYSTCSLKIIDVLFSPAIILGLPIL